MIQMNLKLLVLKLRELKKVCASDKTKHFHTKLTV